MAALYTHWPLSSYSLLVPAWIPFCFITALIVHGINSTRCWRHSSEILVHIGIIVSRNCCKCVSCTSMMPPHPKRALLDWYLVTVEALWVQWTHCYAQETSLRWLKLCDMVQSSHQKIVHCDHKGLDRVSGNVQVNRCNQSNKVAGEWLCNSHADLMKLWLWWEINTQRLSKRI